MEHVVTRYAVNCSNCNCSITNVLTITLDICIGAWLDSFQGERQQGVKESRIEVLEGMVNELWTCPEATQSLLPGERTVGPSALFHAVHQNLPC